MIIIPAIVFSVFWSVGWFTTMALYFALITANRWRAYPTTVEQRTAFVWSAARRIAWAWPVYLAYNTGVALAPMFARAVDSFPESSSGIQIRGKKKSDAQVA